MEVMRNIVIFALVAIVVAAFIAYQVYMHIGNKQGPAEKNQSK